LKGQGSLTRKKQKLLTAGQALNGKQRSYRPRVCGKKDKKSPKGVDRNGKERRSRAKKSLRAKTRQESGKKGHMESGGGRGRQKGKKASIQYKGELLELGNGANIQPESNLKQKKKKPETRGGGGRGAVDLRTDRSKPKGRAVPEGKPPRTGRGMGNTGVGRGKKNRQREASKTDRRSRGDTEKSNEAPSTKCASSRKKGEKGGGWKDKDLGI